MLTLAVDTSNSSLSLALGDEDRIYGKININNGLVHSTTLMSCIDQIFKLSHLKFEDVELFCTTIGPGSFTGIRIGISTVNAFAKVRGVNVASICSLEALAQNANAKDAIIIPTADAQRDNFYMAKFQYKEDELFQIEENSIKSREEIENYVRENQDQKIILLGDINLEDPIEGTNLVKLRNEDDFIDCAKIIDLAIKKEKNSENSNIAIPLYMRKSQAEVVYEQKHSAK